MANKNLFATYRGTMLPTANTVNEAGGIAYRFEDKHALAQYAATGCLNGTYYSSAGTQLAAVLKLCERIEPEFIARTALYARQHGCMKDLPALLTAVLSIRGPGLMAEVFERVIDSPKMLRNFVQIIRSGAIGRKSLGSLPKRMVTQWLEQRTDEQLFVGSVGTAPSLADIVRMVHPKPATASRAALLGYLIGRPYEAKALPGIVREFEAYKLAADRATLETPDVPYQMLTALDLGAREWKAIASRASWQSTRMNLNTFARHGVFDDSQLTKTIVDRLRNPKLIAAARVFPYQLLVAFKNASADLPPAIAEALQDAMEIAIANVPQVDGKVYIFPDISSSMRSPITGFRNGATTAVRCVDVAALVAAAMLRRNPTAEIVPFETQALTPSEIGLNPRDSVMTNAAKLASLPGGGTNCSAPLAYLNQRGATGDLTVYVSDNASWVDSPLNDSGCGQATRTMHEWAAFKKRSPRAKMICIDIQPLATTQAQERDDIINVGGFSDQVFSLIAAVANGDVTAGYWVRQIESMTL